ncbi:hypothetical protein Taro_003203 [Colocasia esculenta]|uniref:CCHC-type domain-containing protein n=1 Tax=Colocasia esculenta TaxID=4460 RepID=A0A843TR32_COLES|nr:hypothetical protein [Colocasia esculenta]
MASRGRRGGAPAREDEPRREERAEQQAPAPQGAVLPPPPPVDYGVFMKELMYGGLHYYVHGLKTAQLMLLETTSLGFEEIKRLGATASRRLRGSRLQGFQASSTPAVQPGSGLQGGWDPPSPKRGCGGGLGGSSRERGGTSADLELSRPCLSSSSFRLRLWKAGIRMGKERASNRNEGFDSKLHVTIQNLNQKMMTLAFDHRTLDEALSAACRQEGEMEQYLEEKKTSQKRPAATFQQQDKKKAVYQTQQRSVAVGNAQVLSVRSPGVKKECPYFGKTHGGSECWMITGKCLNCGSSDHKIKDCPRLQQGVQRGAPAPAAVAATAPATGRPGRPRALARVFALAREDAEQAEHVTKGLVGDATPLEEAVESDSERGD